MINSYIHFDILFYSANRCSGGGGGGAFAKIETGNENSNITIIRMINVVVLHVLVAN